MLVQNINPGTDAERILIAVKNVDGSGSITTGMGAAFVQTLASGSGFQVVKTTAGANNFAGVALADIAINAVGLVTAYGFAASVFISQSVGSFTITAGDQLIQSATQAGAFTSVVTNAALSAAMFKYVIALGALGDTMSNPRPYLSGFVRAI